ncbi:MAG: glycosyltransferase family 39 protein [Spirosomataceae bacterium]|jgi:uncharacterized membrane protein
MVKYIPFVVVFLIASLLRFYNLDNRGLFTDEKFTMLNANGIWVGGANQPEILNNQYFTPEDFWKPKKPIDFTEAIAHSDFGTHIVYNTILFFWMKVFGNSDYTVRLLGLIFNLITIVLIYWAVNKYSRSRLAAAFAALILAVDPLNVAMSHIARSYTLSFLLMSIATVLFFEIIEKFRNGKSINRLFVFYALIVGLGLLNHYLNFLVPLSHGLTFLFIKNKKALWGRFILTAVFCGGLMFYWFNWGGGHTAFEFLKDKNEKHLKIAKMKQGSLKDLIQLSTPENVTKKSIALFFDSTIFSAGIFNEMKGVMYLIYSFLIFAFGLIFLRYYKKHRLAYIFIILILPLLFLLKSVIPALVVVLFFYATLYFIVKNLLEHFKSENHDFPMLMVGFLMLVLPILFVVYDALKNGHTTSLIHRYIGISTPFVAMVFGFSIYKMIVKSKIFLVWLLAVIGLQFKPVSTEITNYFNDRSEMNAFFIPARVPNPYKNLADLVLKNYSPGDTLSIPGKHKNEYVATFDDVEAVSYLDVQYLNLYLPKKSKILQTLNKTEADKVYLHKKGGEKVLLFDFEGIKYRY